MNEIIKGINVHRRKILLVFQGRENNRILYADENVPSADDENGLGKRGGD